ncbi:hypothetical protein JS531_10670 [Bifidobacterium sp. CP2]|uniref:hypothetical protein n=1 Tax=Bifidobacterium sp. CP2 TaxID=2809025 RepID=UPI001BDC05D7|nr:hypothetical protein [Bifidobacterium sp. CP2]MBT1182398.1 hypothetical protein [Bifidobacterium sp. CP2]
MSGFIPDPMLCLNAAETMAMRVRRRSGSEPATVPAPTAVLGAFTRERHSYSSVTIPAGMAQMPSVPRRPIASDRGNVTAEANAAMPVMYAEYMPVASDA